MGEGLQLRGLRVVQQRTGGAQRQRGFLPRGDEAGQVAGAEVVAQQLLGAVGVEMPVGPPSNQRRIRLGQGERRVIGEQDLRRFQPGQLAGQGACGRFQQAELAAGQVQPGHPHPLPFRGQRQQQAVAAVIEQGRISERAGGDDTHHLALHRPLAGGRVTDLFADRHRFAEFHQAGEVLLDGMVGHTGHRDRLAGRLAAPGQRDVDQACRTLGVGKEQLVEVTHAIEQQYVGMRRFQAQILLDHRRVLLQSRRGGIAFIHAHGPNLLPKRGIPGRRASRMPGLASRDRRQ